MWAFCMLDKSENMHVIASQCAHWRGDRRECLWCNPHPLRCKAPPGPKRGRKENGLPRRFAPRNDSGCRDPVLLLIARPGHPGGVALQGNPMRDPAFGLFIKISVYFLCKLCYTIVSVRRGWADPGRIERKYAFVLRAEKPSTRRFRVNGDGAGRFGFMRFFERNLELLKGVYE